MSMKESYCTHYYITDFIVDDHQIMGGCMVLTQGHKVQWVSHVPYSKKPISTMTKARCYHKGQEVYLR